ELKIPEEFCNEDLDKNSDYTVALDDLMEQHVICYDVEKDLLPLVLSNCQYSLERGHETLSEYDLPRIQQQFLTRFLQGKPLITRTGIPTLINTQQRDYGSIFKTIKGKVSQDLLVTLTQNSVSRELDSYSEVCEALKVVDLLLGFLSLTGGDPRMPVVTYLKDKLKMGQSIDEHIQKVSRSREDRQIAVLGSGSYLRLSCELSLEYQEPLTEQNKTELKGFMSHSKSHQWLLEMHEFILLNLSHPHATDRYKPSWGVKEAMDLYMDQKQEEVPVYVEQIFPMNLLLSQILETWKYVVTSKREWMEG
uniref:Uncharacterized protein n=1 Tax=Cyprinodon variegatus TaxID=28743 RepID=A0A3Q2DEF5_CYPVA